METKTASFKGFPKSSGVGQTSGSGGWVIFLSEAIAMQSNCNGLSKSSDQAKRIMKSWRQNLNSGALRGRKLQIYRESKKEGQTIGVPTHKILKN